MDLAKKILRFFLDGELTREVRSTGKKRMIPPVIMKLPDAASLAIFRVKLCNLSFIQNRPWNRLSGWG